MSTLLPSAPIAEAGARPPHAPPPPPTLADTGLGAGFVQELLLKVLYTHGGLLGQALCDVVRLPFALVDEELHALQQRRLLEVRGTGAQGRGAYTFDLASLGRERAQEALASCSYVGPAPVPLDQYSRWLAEHTVRDVHVRRTQLQAGFADLVLDAELLERLGPAINSAKSLFLFGESGNGKTVIAEAVGRLLDGGMYVPYAVKVEGQIVLVHDPLHHRPPEEPAPAPGDAGISIWRGGAADYDRRFAWARRPVVVTGGELTLDDLELRYDAASKLYQAPFQVKANGGVLIIDDFGRQRVPPRDLLNRWIVPLEKRVDYLTLHTGTKFPIPVDCFLVFATNLEPRSLVEEAFLRRICYKIHVPGPTREQYMEIFHRCCKVRGIHFLGSAVDRIYRRVYGESAVPPRACHARDIVDHLVDVARFREMPPILSDDLVDAACASYFLDVEPIVHDRGGIGALRRPDGEGRTANPATVGAHPARD
jgi:predicted ATPase with chaperone activity